MTLLPHWLKASNVQTIFSLLALNGGEGRIVGGAVRDHLMGLDLGDIDFCTTHNPQQIIKLAQENGVKYIETGVEFGTVTWVVDGQAFEITSLREDVKTDGRHALVQYGTSFQQDALRRDFTINALYMAANGEVFDPLGSGLHDIKQKQIRFIGQPKQRIEEDYLRILRYFRFIACYDLSFDADECAQIAPLVLGLKQLSAERIYAELKRLFAGEYLNQALILMSEVLIFEPLFGLSARRDAATYFQKSTLSYNNIWLIRFLLSFPNIDADSLVETLKISNKQRKMVKYLNQLPNILTDDLTELSKNIYRFGAVIVRDNLLYYAGLHNLDHDILTQKLDFVETFDLPIFPINGQDLMAVGYEAGPELGKALKRLVALWLEQDFKPTKTWLLSQI
ncbi:MAG: CCA tRNA nucleotidyltransferase [Rhizobiales bacterium]|nr:CCA tRNA nucleotidyltransferase [Hyphomicrobiales bacterium]NRB14097.1 CCA tRNA nucleotidyltransferase [Hyphomicrobiales bacterium]